MGSPEPFEQDAIVVIETNLDDATGELLGWLMERLLAAGALDVAYSPLQMKKQRPGTLVRVIVRPADTERIAALLIRETPTLGVRYTPMQRLIAGRRSEQVTTPWGAVEVKVKLIGDRIVAASPEYDDCRTIALARAEPLVTVTARIEAWLLTWYHLD